MLISAARTAFNVICSVLLKFLPLPRITKDVQDHPVEKSVSIRVQISASMPDTTCKFGQFVQQRGKLSTTRWKLFFSKLVSLLTLLWPSPSRLPTPCRLLHTSSSCCVHPVTQRTLPETSLSARSALRSNSAHPSEIQSTNTKSNWINYRQKKQECILQLDAYWSAGVAVCLGSSLPGECLSRRVSAQEGVCPEVVCLGGGVCLGMYISLLWTEFLTHACENITFPQLRLRTVIINLTR